MIPPTTLAKKKSDFDPRKFLATIGNGRRVVAFPKKETIFAQGDAADAVFYIQAGKIRLTVVSKIGKEATLGILGEGQFFGEGSLAGQALRMGSATAMTNCELLRIDKKAMMLALHREHAFSDLFVAYLLARNIRYEEDLVDQLFNSSEKRLARLLLLFAHFGKEGTPETVIPKISQETLADMTASLSRRRRIPTGVLPSCSWRAPYRRSFGPQAPCRLDNRRRNEPRSTYCACSQEFVPDPCKLSRS